MSSRLWWLSLMLGLLACGPAQPSSGDAGVPDAGLATGRVTGSALLSGTGPHDGIAVSLMGTGLETTTDAEGRFLLENVPEGTHELVAQKQGYSRQRQPVTVAAGETASVSMALAQQVGRVEGKVQLQGEASHSDITVTLAGTRLSVTTREDGGFLLESVPVGTYRLVATKTGYETERMTVEVTEGNTVSPSLSLPALVGSVRGYAWLEGPSSDDSGIAVRLEPLGSSTTTTTTGSFRFEDVRVGTHSLVFEMAGYETARRSVQVKSGQIEFFTVTLNKTSHEERGIDQDP